MDLVAVQAAGDIGRILQKTLATFSKNQLQKTKIQGKYANPILLIIDECLLLKPTETEQHDILELLHRRRKKSSTIFCSQYDVEGWYDQLGGDASPLADVNVNEKVYQSLAN